MNNFKLDSKLLIKIIVYFLLLIAVISIILKIIGVDFHNIFFKKLESNLIYSGNEINFILIFFILMSISYLFMLPLNYIFTIFAAYMINNILISFTFIYISLILNSIIYFLIYNKLLDKEFLKEFKEKYPLVSTVHDKFKNNLLKSSLIIRFMFIPTGIKDLILIILNINLLNYTISSLIFYCVLSLQNTWAGYQLKNFKEIKKGYVNIISLLILILLVTMNIGIGLFLGIYLKKISNSIKKENYIDNSKELVENKI